MNNAQTPSTRTLILGAGGHGRVVLDILTQDRSCDVIGFLDGNPNLIGRRVDGCPVLGTIDQLAEIAAEQKIQGAIVAIGDNGVRRALARKISAANLELVNAIHPSATLAQRVLVGHNVVICAGVVVCAHCQIGDSVILNTGCIIDHYTMIGEGAHICPGARLAGRVKVEPGTFVGIGATVIPKVTLGCEAIVGAGTVVLEDVESMATVVGVPGRCVRGVEDDPDTAAMLLPARPTAP